MIVLKQRGGGMAFGCKDDKELEYLKQVMKLFDYYQKRKTFKFQENDKDI